MKSPFTSCIYKLFLWLCTVFFARHLLFAHVWLTPGIVRFLPSKFDIILIYKRRLLPVFFIHRYGWGSVEDVPSLVQVNDVRWYDYTSAGPIVLYWRYYNKYAKKIEHFRYYYRYMYIYI